MMPGNRLKQLGANSSSTAVLTDKARFGLNKPPVSVNRAAFLIRRPEIGGIWKQRKEPFNGKEVVYVRIGNGRPSGQNV